MEQVAEYALNLFPVDMDGDGRDEIAIIDNRPSEPWAALHLETQEGKPIDQVNYPAPLKMLYALDVDGDDLPEILAPFVLNDSLFVSVIDNKGQELNRFFLTEGKPRSEKGGLIPWDPHVRVFLLADVNADGRDELLTIISTGLAHLPRGVLIHSLPDGQSLGRCIIGANPSIHNLVAPPGLHSAFLGNYDEDSRPEILFATSSSNNGAEANGMNDRQSYLGVFDLDPPRVLWKQEIGDVWTDMHLRRGNFGEEGSHPFLGFKDTHRSPSNQPGELYLLDATGRIDRKHTLTGPLKDVAVADLDRDARDEIVVLGASGELLLFDGGLKLIKSHRLADSAKHIRTFPDSDGDLVPEIAVWLSDGEALLDPRLRVKAFYPKGHFEGVIRQSVGRLPLLFGHGANGRIYTFRLVRNRLYLFYRFGPWVLWILGAGLVLTTCLVVVSYYQRRRQLGKAVRIDVERSLDQTRRVQTLADNLERHVIGIQGLLGSMQTEYRKDSEGAERLDRYIAAIEKEAGQMLQWVRQFSEWQPPGLNHNSEQSTERAFLEKAKGVVEAFLGTPGFSVEQFAGEMGYSPRQLQRRMKEASGCSPGAYIMQIRLAHAAELLEEPDSRINEVAAKVGFRNPNHFSTKFREAYGVSPSAYKNK
ncbi:MAG: helix-turn-helix domain-containing protein [Rhodothermales bacterium]